MKRYKVTYWREDKSNLMYLFQISKSGKWDGTRIWFYGDGKKDWQDNWKKNKTQGIQITFEL